MNYSSLAYKIALSLIPGVGNIMAKKLIAYTGSIEGVFAEKKGNLLRIPGVGKTIAENVSRQTVLELAELEAEYVKAKGVRTYFYLDPDYPERLKHCPDAPVLLFVSGAADLNHTKALSLVGTRRATQEGKDFVERFIAELKERNHHAVIVSGLAYGIDIAAHRAALRVDLPTVAVLGHGLETIYPSTHYSVSREIVKQGALVTEFLSHDKPEPPYFVKRNRIIAGLADATIVVESGEQGGALITADIANSYNRDVFAVPGRVTDSWSKGCNVLIKTNRAALLESVKDIEYLLGWEKPGSPGKALQPRLFAELGEEEQCLVEILRDQSLTIDEIARAAGMPVSKVSPLLLNIEFAGLVKCLPGKIYRLNQ